MSAVSVVVPTFNRARYIGEALRSVLGQTVAPHEIVVVDDGSTDDTAGVVAAFAPRVRYLRKENGGKSTALNLALPLLTGDFVWVFDDDDVALPDALERHLAVMAARPDAGFTWSSVLSGASAADDSIVRGPEVEIEDVAEDEVFVRLLEECFIVGQPAILVLTSAYREAGPFDETLVRSQDYEMLLRLARSHRAARVAGPTMIQRRHEGVRGAERRRFRAEERHAQWNRHDREIFARLHGELALREYLPGSPSVSALDDPAKRRRALLQRAVVFARKGMWELALLDLAAAIELLRLPRAAITVPEREMCARMLNGRHGCAELLARPALARQLARTIQVPAAEPYAAHLAQGLIAYAAWRFDQREVRGTLELAGLLFRLFGWRELRYLLEWRRTRAA